MFALWNRFQKLAQIEGKDPEKIVLTRTGKSASSMFKSNFVYTGLLRPDTKIENGDVITRTNRGQKETFLVVSMRPADTSIQATLYKCNAFISIYRVGGKMYDENDNLIDTGLVHVTDVPASHVTINLQMRVVDSGILPSTTKEFRIPKCDIKELDRITYDGNNYCVDTVDYTKFDGLLAVQVSNDNRSL